jgi:hypothetical protein
MCIFGTCYQNVHMIPLYIFPYVRSLCYHYTKTTLVNVILRITNMNSMKTIIMKFCFEVVTTWFWIEVYNISSLLEIWYKNIGIGYIDGDCDFYFASQWHWLYKGQIWRWRDKSNCVTAESNDYQNDLSHEEVAVLIPTVIEAFMIKRVVHNTIYAWANIRSWILSYDHSTIRRFGCQWMNG